jgi:hypothetical protein
MTVGYLPCLLVSSLSTSSLFRLVTFSLYLVTFPLPSWRWLLLPRLYESLFLCRQGWKEIRVVQHEAWVFTRLMVLSYRDKIKDGHQQSSMVYLRGQCLGIRDSASLSSLILSGLASTELLVLGRSPLTNLAMLCSQHELAARSITKGRQHNCDVFSQRCLLVGQSSLQIYECCIWFSWVGVSTSAP